MRNKLNNMLMRVERDSVNWIIKNRHRIYFYVAMSFLLIAFSYLPFLNLFLGRSVVIFLLFFLAISVFSMPPSFLASISIILLVVAIPLLLAREYETAELLGSYVYAIFAFIALKFLTNSEK